VSDGNPVFLSDFFKPWVVIDGLGVIQRDQESLAENRYIQIRLN
jgi:hypothetical protein